MKIEELLKQNFISTNKSAAINSYGDVFTIGNIVIHDDGTAGEATITGFEIDDEYNEVKVFTTSGYAHVDFISHKDK